MLCVQSDSELFYIPNESDAQWNGNERRERDITFKWPLMAGLILAWVKPLCGPQEWSLKKGLWMCVYVCERVWANEGACRPEFVSDYTKCISFFLTSCINVSLKTLCHCQSKGTRNLCCSDDSTVHEWEEYVFLFTSGHNAMILIQYNLMCVPRILHTSSIC